MLEKLKLSGVGDFDESKVSKCSDNENMALRKKKTKINLRKPRQERAQETFNLILETAERILKKEGVDALNTNRISEVGGVSIGSVYQYFDNKEAIIIECHRRYGEKYLGRFVSFVEAEKPKNLRACIKALAEGVIYAHRVDAAAHRSIAEAYKRINEPVGVQKVLSKPYYDFFLKSLLVFKSEIRRHDTEIMHHIFFHSLDRLVHVITESKAPSGAEEKYLEHTVELLYAYLTCKSQKI